MSDSAIFAQLGSQPTPDGTSLHAAPARRPTGGDDRCYPRYGGDVAQSGA